MVVVGAAAPKAALVKVVGHPAGAVVKVTAADGQVGPVIHPAEAAVMPPPAVAKSRFGASLA